MLAVLIIWLYTFAILFLYGLAALQILNRIFKIGPSGRPPAVLVFFLGAAVLTTLASILSLFLRIRTEAFELTLAGAILIAVIFFKEGKRWLVESVESLKNIHPLVWIVLVLALLTTLEVATHKPDNPDTGLYHAQAIRWIETYPAVPGLGNLHGRLAFNSSWFVLAALFSMPFLGIRSFHLTGSVLYLASLFYFTGGLMALLRKDLRVSVLIKTAFLPLTFYILAAEVSSTGTDMPATLLTWVILTIWLEGIEARKASQSDAVGLRLQTILLFLLVIYTLTIKLSAAPLLLLPLAWLASSLREKRFRQAAWLVGLSLIITLPWFARNYVVSGWLVYPQAQIDLFNVDWKIPRQAVIDEADWITSWARYPRLPKDVVLAMPVWRWGATWFSDQTLNRQILFSFLAAAPFVLGLAVLAGWFFFRAAVRRFLAGWKDYLPAAVLAYCGVAFWFFTVPGIRFGNGFNMFTLVLVLLAFSSFFTRLLKPLLRLLPMAAGILIVAYLGLTLYLSIDRRTLAERWILPMDYVNLPTAPCEFDSFSIFCATQYSQCGYEPFPCAPAGLPWVEMRGASFADGFRNIGR